MSEKGAIFETVIETLGESRLEVVDALRVLKRENVVTLFVRDKRWYYRLKED